MRGRPPRPLEADIQRTILDYLALRGIFHYRNNSGAMVSEYKGRKRFMRFGAAGSPDIVCVIGGRYVGIEVKRPGGKQSDDQKEFQARLEAAGGRYLVVHSVEQIHELLKGHSTIL